MKKLFLIRRIVGGSMLPSLLPGRIVFCWRSRQLRRGDVVVFSHDGIEKIKRIRDITGDRLFLHGDNVSESTDSRHFGWIDRSQILARVIWPRCTMELSGDQ